MNDTDKSNVTDSTVFKNQRNSSDTDTYNLRKNYYRVYQKICYKSSQSIRRWGHLSVVFGTFLKTHPTWKDRIGGSGLNWPTTGNCNATDRNCPEYSGTISVSGNTVTFTATHGMDWNAGIKPLS